MSKILLVADIEGCIGITDLRDIENCKMKGEQELSFIVNIIRRSGDHQIALLDCHDNGDLFTAFAYREGIMHLRHIWSLDNSFKFDKALMIGFHSKRDAGGTLSHTIRPDIKRLFIGKNDIGEIALIINLLNHYAIPIIYISGDETVKFELPTDFLGVFCQVKSIIANNTNYFPFVRDCVEKALSLNISCNAFDNSCIRVELIDQKFNRFIPNELCTIVDHSLCFSDTLSFVANLEDFCYYLNMAQNYYYRRYYRLRKLTRLKYSLVEEISDERILFLLSKNYHTLTEEEINELFKFVN